MSGPLTGPVYVLAGPTASGKSEIAHRVARRTGWAVLSADAMQVYRGMDIGTDKPSAGCRRSLVYGGVDLVAPNCRFSVARYHRCAVRFLREQRSAGRAVLVAGGSGLYISVLLQGLEERPPADTVLRRRAEELLAREGIDGLREWVRRLYPRALEKMPDPDNPRRLVRLAECGGVLPRRSNAVHNPVIAGLLPDDAWLRTRIHERVNMMYDGGLLDEVRDIRRRYGRLSTSAGGAIGYAEAQACIDGRIDEQAARLKTEQRTNRLARKQKTWFRHQMHVSWVKRAADDDIRRLTGAVIEVWNEHGAAYIAG